MPAEIAYVLVNSAMPDLVKIGRTTQADVEQRMSQLYTTGVPVPFECLYAIEVEDSEAVESALQTAFGPYRINPKREFFKIDPEQAIAILRLLKGKEVTPEVNQQLNTNVSEVEKESINRIRRPHLNFEEMGIPVGSVLLFEDGVAKAEVVAPRKVKFNNEEMSLTAATKIAMNIQYPIQPGPHWTFEGKTIREYYNDTYSTEEDT